MRVLFLTMVCFALAGCGSRSGVTEITGTVTLHDQPLTEVAVIFWATEFGRGVMECPEVSPAGEYKIYPDPERGEGNTGGYTVYIGDLVPGKLMGAALRNHQPGKRFALPKLPSRSIPSQYQKRETSPLVVELHDGPNEVNLELDSRRFSQ